MAKRSKTIEEAVSHANKNRNWKLFIRLWCPKCYRSTLSAREEHDYPEARLIVMHCPECVGGDFDELVYFDEAGNHVCYDVKEIGTPEHPLHPGLLAAIAKDKGKRP